MCTTNIKKRIKCTIFLEVYKNRPFLFNSIKFSLHFRPLWSEICTMLSNKAGILFVKHSRVCIQHISKIFNCFYEAKNAAHWYKPTTSPTLRIRVSLDTNLGKRIVIRRWVWQQTREWKTSERLKFSFSVNGFCTILHVESDLWYVYFAIQMNIKSSLTHFTWFSKKKCHILKTYFNNKVIVEWKMSSSEWLDVSQFFEAI